MAPPDAPTPEEQQLLLQLFDGTSLDTDSVEPLGPPGLFRSVALRVGRTRRFQYTHRSAVFLVAGGQTFYLPPPRTHILTELRAVPLPVEGASPRWAALATHDLGPLLLVQLQRLDAMAPPDAAQALAVLDRLAGHTGHGSEDLLLPGVARTFGAMTQLLEHTRDRRREADATLEELLPLDAVKHEIAGWAAGPRTEHLALASYSRTHDGQAGGSTTELCLLRLQVGHTRWRFERQLVRREVVDGMELS